MKIRKILNSYGFTLVELLVAVSVLGVLGVVITSVLVQSLKGEKKVQILNQTKQSAQVILEKIIKDVQSSSYVYCVGDSDTAINQNTDSSAKDTLVLVTLSSSGVKTYNQYRYFAEVSNTSNGYITFDTSTDPSSSSTSPLPCDPQVSVRPSAQILTDKDTSNGISLTYDNLGYVFYDNHSDASPDSITIKFRANAGVASQVLFNTSEQQSGNNGIGFGSTTTLRNGSI